MRIVFLILLVTLAGTAIAQKASAPPTIGIAHEYSNDRILHTQGYHHLIESTQKLFSPVNVTEAQFQEHLHRLQQLQTPLLGTNLFIPAHLKVVGPEIDEQALLDYVDVVLRRASKAGVQFIIWGSGGSRQIPEGFDRQHAKKQFVSIARKLAELAAQNNITLVIENLNKEEVNFINTVAEALEIAKLVNHTNLRVCADIYHMLKEGEAPTVIEQGKGYIAYAELAEKEGRSAPGVHHQDFKPYLRALKAIGFQGPLVLECRWQELPTQGTDAYQYIQKQITEVWGK